MSPIKTSKVQKIQNEQDAAMKSQKPTSSISIKCNRSNEMTLVNARSSSLERMDTSSADMSDPMTKVTTQPVRGESTVPKIELDSAMESDEDLAFRGDSDEEKLVIDDSVATKTQLKPNTTPVSETATVNSELSSPQKGTRRLRQAKKSKESGDQLGQILQMQSAMFNSSSNAAKSSTIPQEVNSLSQNVGPAVHSHPISLVKSFVSSYLEQNQDRETSSTPLKSAPLVNTTATEQKSWFNIFL